jgi:methylated-DNA-[protein]-cysteine S-methyltransferase
MDPANQLSTFWTPVGWIGVVGQGDAVVALTFGQAGVGAVHRKLLGDGVISRSTSPTEWCPQLRERLIAYAEGAVDDFADIPIVDTRTTDFQRAVVRVVRSLGYGRTLSYGEVAKRAGSAGAARAVGHVMATNPVPLLIPCHRVVAVGGKLGGYSGADGLRTKQRLLALEGANVPAATPGIVAESRQIPRENTRTATGGRPLRKNAQLPSLGRER